MFYNGHIALIIKNHKVVSVGTSSGFKGCSSNCYTRHAEKDALSKVKNTKGCILVSMRFRENWMESRPCTHCSMDMINAQIKKVVFMENGQWKIETPIEALLNSRPTSSQRIWSIPNNSYKKKYRSTRKSFYKIELKKKNGYKTVRVR